MEKDKTPLSNNWFRSVANGFFAYSLAFFVYMVPGFIVSVKMGFTLGPQSNDPGAISAEISQTISKMYSGNALFGLLFIILTILFIIWRSRAVIKKYRTNPVQSGLLVSVIPVLMSLMFMIGRGFDWFTVVEIILYAGAGYLSGTVLKPAL